MGCDDARDALSAALDGELGAAESEAVERHLAACAGCRRHQADLAALHRRLRVRPADAVPDLTAAVVAGVALPGRRDTGWARYALLTVALTRLVLALPAFLAGGDGGPAAAHGARELAAFDVALSACLLVAAWQPRRAAGLLPVAVAVAAAMVAGAVADVAVGRTPLASEGHHALELLGLLFLWLVARPRRRAGPPAAAPAGPVLAA